MALEEIISKEEQLRTGKRALGIFGSIFLSILCPFNGLPLLALTYYDQRKAKRVEPSQTNPVKYNKPENRYSSRDEYFNRVYEWLRTRKENEKSYEGYYNLNGKDQKVSIRIS